VPVVDDHRLASYGGGKTRFIDRPHEGRRSFLTASLHPHSRMDVARG